MSSRVAAIDIGTNSVLLLVAERGPDGALRPVVERAMITRLGEGVDRSGEIAAAARERTLACLAEYGTVLRDLGVAGVHAVGTSAMRDARGGPEFADAALAVLGVRPRIVSGDEEARLTFMGSLSGLTVVGPVAVIDIGGGSTEIVRGERSGDSVRIDRKGSVNVGSVRLHERHVRHDPPTAEERAAIARDADEAIAAFEPCPPGTPIVGVAGTVTTIAAVARSIAPYDGARVHGLTLTREEVTGVCSRLGSLTLEERKRVPGLDPRRADVIVAGAIILERALAWAGASSLITSDRGVRWGLAEEALPWQKS